MVARILPLETLSPIFTSNEEILPEKGDGTSTLDLSLSRVTTGSSFFILAQGFVKISII